MQALPSKHLVVFGSKCLSGLSAASWDLVAASVAFSQEYYLFVCLLLAVKRIPSFCLTSSGFLLGLLSLLPLSIHLQGLLQVRGCRALAEEFEEVLLSECPGIANEHWFICASSGRSSLLKSLAKGVRADPAARRWEMNVGVCPDKDCRNLASITLRVVS